MSDDCNIFIEYHSKELILVNDRYFDFLKFDVYFPLGAKMYTEFFDVVLSIVGFGHLTILLIFMEKRISHKVFPCVIPSSWFWRSESMDPICTVKFLWNRIYEKKQSFSKAEIL